MSNVKSFPSANHSVADLWQEPSGDIRKDLSEWFPDDLDPKRFSNALEGAVMEREDPMAQVPVGSVWETHLVLFVRLTHPRRVANLEHIAKSEATIIEGMTGERLIVWVSEFGKKTAFDCHDGNTRISPKKENGVILTCQQAGGRHASVRQHADVVCYHSLLVRHPKTATAKSRPWRERFGIRASSLIRISALVIRHFLRLFAFFAANLSLTPEFLHC